MPYTISFETPRRFVIRASGDLPGSESLESFRRILADPRFGEGATMLTIATDVTRAPATDELATIASAVKDLFARGLRGFVIVTDPGFVYGVARMFTVVAEMMGVPSEVTQDEAEGRLLLERIERDVAGGE